MNSMESIICMEFILLNSFLPVVTPLLPVIIGLAAAHENYGVRDENGQLQL